MNFVSYLKDDLKNIQKYLPDSLFQIFSDADSSETTTMYYGIDGFLDNQLDEVQYLNLSGRNQVFYSDEINRFNNLRAINLSNNYIKDFSWLENTPNLEMLILNNCEIERLPEEIVKYLPKLKFLSLAGNQISEINIEGSNIVYLNLYSNILSHITLDRNMKLSYLDIGANKLQKVPTGISNVNSILDLSLAENRILSLDNIQDSIISLNLRGNDLLSIPESIKKLNKIEHVNLSFNRIKYPSVLFDLGNLKSLFLSENLALVDFDFLKSMFGLNILSISRNKLTLIPDVVFELKELRELYLGENKISVVENKIENLANLERLNLYANNITAIPNAVGRLKKIKYLDFSNNKINEIPGFIYNLDQIEELRLNQNHINFICSDIKNMKNLKSVFLQKNSIEKIPFEIFELKNIETLDFSSNKIKKIEQYENVCTSLKYLNISDNNIGNLNEEFNYIPNLQQLFVSYNQLTSFPASICKLTKLVDLDLSSNQLNSISDEIGALSRLVNFHFSLNKITELPISLTNCKRLNYIALGSNEIVEFSSIFSNLPNLNQLYIQNNKITKFILDCDANFNLQAINISNNIIREFLIINSKSNNLQKLIINGNLLTDFPIEIDSLTNLKELIAHNNKILTLPVTIGNLFNVEKIDLNNNRILELPEEIGNNNKLLNFSISGNNLKVIPDSIGNLSNLVFLFIENNKLEKVPLSIANLNNLIALSLIGNPFGEMPDIFDTFTNLKGYNYVNTKLLFEQLKESQGYKKFTALWHIPNALQTSFQQYLNFLTDYVSKTSGKEMSFDVTKCSEGLLLTTTSTPTLTIDEINDYLKSYINILLMNKEELYVFLSRSERLDERTFDVRNLVRDLIRQRDNWHLTAQTYRDYVMLLSKNIEEKERRIQELLNIKIELFDDINQYRMSILQTDGVDLNSSISIETVSMSSAPLLSAGFGFKIQRLCEENRVEEALVELKKHFNEIGDKNKLSEVIVLSGSLEEIKKQQRMGSIEVKEYLSFRSKTLISVLELSKTL